jgi:predicted dehydrogenase
MDTIKTLVIGCGRRSRLADHQVLQQAGFVIAAGVDPVATQRAAWHERHPQARVHAELAAALASERPEAVIVTSPDHCHVADACAALEAGAAVYCEKPLAVSLADADRILATAQASGSKLYVGHNMRHMPCIQAMKALIDEGAIGRVQAAWCRHFIDYGGDAYFKDWHAERRYATSLLLQKGAHDIDVLHWLCGARSQLAVAMGRLSVYDRSSHRAPEDDWDTAWRDEHWPPTSQRGTNPLMDVEDHSMVLLQLANGVQASYQQCHYTPDRGRNYTIIGDEGRIENLGDSRSWSVHLLDRRHSSRTAPDRILRSDDDAADHGGADGSILAEFAAFVRDSAPVRVSAVGARDAVAAGCAATESLRNGSLPQRIPAVAPELAAHFARVEAGVAGVAS